MSKIVFYLKIVFLKYNFKHILRMQEEIQIKWCEPLVMKYNNRSMDEFKKASLRELWPPKHIKLYSKKYM